MHDARVAGSGSAAFRTCCHYERRLRTLLAGPWDVVHIWEEPYVAACAQVASAAPARARVVPATFQNIVKSYPPPLGYFERSVMRRAAGWIAFGETVHEAQAAKRVVRGAAVARHSSRCRRQPLPARRAAPVRLSRAAARLDRRHAGRGFSRALRSGQGARRADAGARRRRAAVARALRGRRPDGKPSCLGIRRRASRAACACSPMSATTTCPSISTRWM